MKAELLWKSTFPEQQGHQRHVRTVHALDLNTFLGAVKIHVLAPRLAGPTRLDHISHIDAFRNCLISFGLILIESMILNDIFLVTVEVKTQVFHGLCHLLQQGSVLELCFKNHFRQKVQRADWGFPQNRRVWAKILRETEKLTPETARLRNLAHAQNTWQVKNAISLITSICAFYAIHIHL